jgi:hypothetical protein
VFSHKLINFQLVKLQKYSAIEKENKYFCQRSSFKEPPDSDKNLLTLRAKERERKGERERKRKRERLRERETK